MDNRNSGRFYFLGLQNHCRWWLCHKIKRDLLLERKAMTNLDKGSYSQSYGFSLESPLDCKEIQPVHPKGDQSWVFIGRTDAEAEPPILWPPHMKSWLIGKDPDAGRDWGQEEKGTTEDEMAGWHHRLNGHEFEWTPGVGDGQGGLACWDSWGHKELDTTERLNWLTDWTTVPATNSTTYPVAVSYSLSALPAYSYPWNVFVIIWV